MSGPEIMCRIQIRILDEDCGLGENGKVVRKIVDYRILFSAKRVSFEQDIMDLTAITAFNSIMDTTDVTVIKATTDTTDFSVTKAIMKTTDITDV